MAFKHACFISYKNGKKEDGQLDDDLLNNFASQIYDALESELGAYFNFPSKVVLDIKFLKAGQLLIQVFSEAIRNSVAMIVIYTPNYLSEDEMYCASELLLMRQVEMKRLQLLNNKLTMGFLITIVLRGMPYLPAYLKNNVFLDFTPFNLSLGEIKRHPDFNGQISRIAEIIFDLSGQIEKEIKESGIEFFSDFQDYKILDIGVPGEAQLVKQFIEEVNKGEIPVIYPQM